MNLANNVKYLLINLFLFIGQASVFDTADINLSFLCLVAHIQITVALLFGP